MSSPEGCNSGVVDECLKSAVVIFCLLVCPQDKLLELCVRVTRNEHVFNYKIIELERIEWSCVCNKNDILPRAKPFSNCFKENN